MKLIIGIIIGVILALSVMLSLPHKENESLVKNKPAPSEKEKPEVKATLKNPLNILEALDKYIELNPTDSNAYLQKADYLAKNGKLKEALPLYDKALHYDPRNAQAYMNRGAVNYMLGNYETAKRDLSAAINLDSSKGENFFNRGLANINLGSYRQAKEDFKTAEALFDKADNKKSSDQAKQAYQAVQAMAAQRKQNNQSAPAKVNKQDNQEQPSFKTSSNEALNKEYTSQLMTSLSNTGSMLEKFKEARQRAGSEPGVMPDFEAYAASMREQAGQKFKQENAQKTFLDYKDEAYKKQAAGDIEGALKAIDKAIELNPKEADLYRQRAQINRAAKDPKAAIADYTKAISLNPKDASSFYDRALLKEMIGDKKGAKQDMKQAENLYQEQGNKEGVKQAKEMQNLWEGKQVSSPRQDKDFIDGANAFNSGKYQEALNHWDNLIKKYPNDASAYYNSAITHAKLGNIEQAEKRYKEAIKHNPNMAEALDGLSSTLIGQGKVQEALPYIAQSLKINPENPTAYNMRAFAIADANPNGAIRDFSQSIAYDRENPSSYYGRGIVYIQSGNIEAGVSDLQNAINYAKKQKNQKLAEAAQNILDQIKQQGN